VDVGFLFELERPQDRSEGYEVKLGPLFQAGFGKTEWIANFLLKNSYQASESSEASAYYQLQGRYLLRKKFSPGFQAFGDLGTWNDWGPCANKVTASAPQFSANCHLMTNNTSSTTQHFYLVKLESMIPVTWATHSACRLNIRFNHFYSSRVSQIPHHLIGSQYQVQ
jgi:hypothetical protein